MFVLGIQTQVLTLEQKGPLCTKPSLQLWFHSYFTTELCTKIIYPTCSYSLAVLGSVWEPQKTIKEPLLTQSQ